MQHLRQKLIPIFFMEDTMAMQDTLDMQDTMEDGLMGMPIMERKRGQLNLNPRQKLIPIFFMEDTMGMLDTLDMQDIMEDGLMGMPTMASAKGQKKARIIYLNSQSLVVKFIFTVHLTYDDLCDLIGHVSAVFGLLSNSKTIP